MESALHRVLRSEELGATPSGQPEIRRVRVGDTDVLVARLLTGQVVAFGSACPHQGTPLQEGSLWDGMLRCRRHLYLYDPVTGENVLPTRETPELLWKLKPGYLPVYAVEERDGWVWVSGTPAPPPPAYDPAREQHPPAPTPEPDVVVEPEPPRPVEHVRVAQGEQFDVVLEVVPRPGHFWRVDCSGGIVSLVAQELLPGDPPRQRLRFVASAAGEQALSCVYARPWDADPTGETRRFVVHVGAAQGATPSG